MALARNGLDQKSITVRLQHAVVENRVFKLAYKAWTILPPVLTGIRWSNVAHLSGNPVLGQFLNAVKDDRGNSEFLSKATRLAQQHPNRKSVAWILHNPVLTLGGEPEDVNQLDHHENEMNRSISHAGIDALFGAKNIFSISSGEEHRRKRAVIKSHVFSTAGLGKLIPGIHSGIDDFFTKNVRPDTIIDAKFFRKLMFQIFIPVMYGAKPLSDDEFEIIDKDYTEAFKSSISHKTNFLIQLAQALGMKKNFSSIERLKETLHQHLREILLKKNEISASKNLLVKLAQLEREQKQKAQKEQKKEQEQEEKDLTDDPPLELDTPLMMADLTTLLFEGTSTLALAAPYIWVYLADPQIRAKLKNEMDKNPEDYERAHEDSEGQTYIRRFMDEVLRLNSVAGVVLKAPTKPFTFAGNLKETKDGFKKAVEDEKRDKSKDVKVTVGDYIVLASYETHLAEANFPEPLKFEPDRYLAGHPLYKPKRGRWIPFGSGARDCPGNKYAYVVLSQVIKRTMSYMEEQKLDLRCNQKHLVKSHFAGLLVPSDPLKFQFVAPECKEVIWPKTEKKPNRCGFYSSAVTTAGISLGAGAIGLAVSGPVAATAAAATAGYATSKLIKNCMSR